MFQPNQLITFPDPHSGGERVAGRFHEVAVGRPATIIDPRYIGGTRRADQAWVSYESGECKGMTALVIYRSIRGA